MTEELTERTLHFKIPARTSRGEYTVHRMLVLKLSDGDRVGYGECAPLPDLSPEYNDIFRTSADGWQSVPAGLSSNVSGQGSAPENVSLRSTPPSLAAGPLPLTMPRVARFSWGRPCPENEYSSMKFARESAMAEMNRDPWLYDTPFARGEIGIPINGLVWMAPYESMLAEMERKIDAGYRCIKLKIGAIEWQDELKLIKKLRERFSAAQLQLRVDANGAFSPEEAPSKLQELAKYDIHSIEQPIRQGQWSEMARLCETSPVPIALDEELIGINETKSKIELLETIRPQYIVVKPTLHGGLSGAHEWIQLARQRNIGSWITSALESNIGLKSIALLAAAEYGDQPQMMSQGLGTGQLYTDNIDTGIYIKDGFIWFSGGVE